MAKANFINGSSGKPQRVRFPIRRTIVENGNPREYVIEEDAETTCIRCGQRFQINGETAQIRNNLIDTLPYIRCPHCGYVAADYYYFTRVPRKRPRRMQTPEDSMIPWTTPEGG